MSNRYNKGTGIRKRVLGVPVSVNLNAKKGYRVSPGVNWRARAVQECAKGQPLNKRKECFAKKHGSKSTE